MSLSIRSGVRHGAYICISVPRDAREAVGTTPAEALAERLGLRNEFNPGHDQPPGTIAFLRRVGATTAQIADVDLLGADAVIHVASVSAGPITEFCTELTRLLGQTIKPRIIGGGLRPTNYTGNAMHNFAYAHRVLQQPGTVMPNGFLVPMSKAGGWWEKDWMERHTYFLPRYDESGHMLNEGHALAAAAGIACLMRRTYKNATEPAPAEAYDFINYFECADEDVSTFHEVCTALRDITRIRNGNSFAKGPHGTVGAYRHGLSYLIEATWGFETAEKKSRNRCNASWKIRLPDLAAVN
jgi:hypothetical protein